MLGAYMQAVRKLETALKLDNSKPETLWCLGNAYTSEVSALVMAYTLIWLVKCCHEVNIPNAP